MICSEEKRLANQTNALKSTGPQTPEGKARSSKNAVKHGLTSAAVILPDEEHERQLFDDLLTSLFQDIAPKGALQETLTFKLAINNWRWRRVLRYELGATKTGTVAVEEWREKQRELVELSQKYADLFNERAIKDWKHTDDLKADFDVAEDLLVALSQPDLLEAPRENLIILLFREAEEAGLNTKRLPKVLGKGRFREIMLSRIEPEDAQQIFEALCKEWNLKPEDCWQKLRCKVKQNRENARVAYERRFRDEEQVKLQASLPSKDNLEKVMRYEAHLSRELNRTLEQLEKTRHMNIGKNEPKMEP